LGELSEKPLPKFNKPPVVETVLGVQFDPLSEFSSALLGAFWRDLGAGWPKVNDAPLLSDQFEHFADGAPAWAGNRLQLRISQNPNSRIRIWNSDDDRMLQVQQTRFHYNWLGHKKGGYPSYTKVIPEFEKYFAKFRSFLSEQSVKPPKLNQWEVTYVNHIPKGELWRSIGDWEQLFPSFDIPDIRLDGISLEDIRCAWHYEIEPNRGRLHVDVQSAKRESDEESEIIILKLTARGPIVAVPDDVTTPDSMLGNGLDLGHEAIVRAFKELTGETAHQHWEENDADS
jgi:uncharacterized protein (TIGR04255 family)